MLMHMSDDVLQGRVRPDVRDLECSRCTSAADGWLSTCRLTSQAYSMYLLVDGL
jgi:hypothetical protein